MHDPSTVAFTIRYPWRAYRKGADRSDFERNYRHPFVTIWHEDPESDGTDDSCGWFMRSRHGDDAALARIVKRFESDWDRMFKSDGGNSYRAGYFDPTSGLPVLSPIGTTINLFFVAAVEHFGGRARAARFMQTNLFEIINFAENLHDSLHETLTGKFGAPDKREYRIRSMASTVYGWILREERAWYRHPKWHVWHWRVQVHPWQNIRRLLLTRCCKCGGMFRYGESPCTNQWDRDRPKFLCGETGLYHSDCAQPSADGAKTEPRAHV